MRRTAVGDGAGWWGVVGAALLLAVLGFALTTYAHDTHRDLAGDVCHAVASLPVAVWAAAVGAPAASLVGAAGTTWLAVAARRRPGLMGTAIVVASLAGLLCLLETYTAVDMLAVDHTNGNTCGF
ncbi:hypothetical protein OG535_23060 [Kitasatospora sp. NBC_00085]|uniref:hypothetical protein n=1 Tax=unclassified Kitasatospora TaxID=2633591 RepID=UPI00324403FD